MDLGCTIFIGVCSALGVLGFIASINVAIRLNKIEEENLKNKL